MALQLTVISDPLEFTARVGEFLAAQEAVNNLLFGILADLPSSPTRQQPLLAVLEDTGVPTVVAVMTPPRDLVLSRSGIPGAVAGLARALQARGVAVPGVSGPALEAQAFAATWMRLQGVPVRKVAAMRIYQATEIIPPVPQAPGRLRLAGPADVDLVARWIAAFNQEAVFESPDPQAALRLARVLVSPQPLLDAGDVPAPRRSMYLWDNDGPVAMTATGGPTPHGGRVYAVYTPPEHRRRGYASACVAAVSSQLLARGLRYCFLFTDLDNATSNHIYQQIGYQPVAPWDWYRFDA